MKGHLVIDRLREHDWRRLEVHALSALGALIVIAGFVALFLS
jgi:uncharacterized membrane protein YdcZ (DUF606 family)